MTTVEIVLNLTGIVNGVAALLLSLATRSRVGALERVVRGSSQSD